MKQWQLISSTPAFHNRWVHIEQKKYQKPDGETIDFFVNEGTEIVSVLGLTNDNKVVVVKQFRPAVSAITVDLPGGGVNKNENPAHAAKREFQEETGLNIVKLKKLITVFHDSGRSNQKKHFFVGEVSTTRYIRNKKLHDECQVDLISLNKLLPLNGNLYKRKIYEPSMILAITFYTLLNKK
ncbi:MAG: NUDIX hydrolase [Candidatus Daviesbacteria bacterium]|nr:NUDIX hydrolase [Candidatus Daviesbacteria bacterium]